jgi:hypothetical protein
MSNTFHNPAGTVPIRLLRLDDAPDSDGEPRGTLILPPTATVRRSVVLLFATVALAVHAKAEMESARA